MQRLREPASLDQLPDSRPGQALRRLLAGNERFAAGPAEQLQRGGVRPSEVAGSQHPFAIVFGCFDSRVSPELVFDCGLGELLVVRTAGHVTDRAVLGSIQLGARALQIPLIVVLGHARCAAVTAAVAAVEGQARPPTDEPDECGYLLRRIEPAVRVGKRLPGDTVANAVDANATMVADGIASEPMIARRMSQGTLAVVAARYDLETGRVGLLTS